MWAGAVRTSPPTSAACVPTHQASRRRRLARTEDARARGKIRSPILAALLQRRLAATVSWLPLRSATAANQQRGLRDVRGAMRPSFVRAEEPVLSFGRGGHVSGSACTGCSADQKAKRPTSELEGPRHPTTSRLAVAMASWTLRVRRAGDTLAAALRSMSMLRYAYRRCALVVACAAAVASGLGIPGAAGVAHAAPVPGHAEGLLAIHFARVGSNVTVLSNGRYVVVQALNRFLGPASATRVLDDRTSRRVALRLPTPTTAVSVATADAWWGTGQSLPGQQPSIGLARLSTGLQSTFASTAGFCTPPDAGCLIGPVGSRWVGIHSSCSRCDPHFGFVDRRTGATEPPPAQSSQRVVDVDAASLLTRLCSPLRTSPANRVILDATGHTTLSGGSMGRYFLAYDRSGHAFLEHCGWQHRLGLPAIPTAADSRAVIWVHDRIFEGERLPSLTRCRAYLPSGAAGGQVVLSERHVWILGSRATLWEGARQRF